MNSPVSQYRCRFCNEPLRETFVDLGLSPLCESYVSPADVGAPEAFYPLHSFVCGNCFLVQLPEHVGAERSLRNMLISRPIPTAGLRTPAAMSMRLQTDSVSGRFVRNRGGK